MSDEMAQLLRQQLLFNSRITRLRRCLSDVQLDLETLFKAQPKNAEAIKGAIEYVKDCLETDLNLHERFGEG